MSAEFSSAREEFFRAQKQRVARNRAQIPAKPAANAAAVLAECAGLVRAIVADADGYSVKARLRAAARVVGLPAGRLADFYYREARRVEAHEADRIRACAAKAARRALLRLEAEYEAMRARLVAEAPRGLGWLCPPALAPHEGDPDGD